MLKEKTAVIRKAMLFFDGFVVSIAFLLAYYLRQHFHTFYKLDLFPCTQLVSDAIGSISDYLIVLLFVVPLWCFMLYLNGMYRSLRTRKLSEIVGIVIKSAFFTILAFGTVVFLFKLHFVSRMFFAIFVVASINFILVEKIVVFFVMHYVRKQGHNFRRLLVVGTGRRTADFIKRIRSHPEWGFRLLGAIDDEPGRGIKKVKYTKILGNINDLSEILYKYAIDEVVFVVPRSRLNYIEKAIYACETEGVRATVAVDLFNLRIARSRFTEIDGIPLIAFETTVADEWHLFIKRAMDVVLSGLGIIVLSPFFLIGALLIKLTSKGPVFFKQERASLNGRKFAIYKFRTMYEGADKKRFEMEDQNEMGGPVFKIKKDPRITPLGKILRKFSIDELTQLFNVFAGHMSLIGPRALPVYEVAKFKPWQRRRLSMRPGITCLWQVNGRNKIGFDEWMKLDLEYLDNWSLWFDFKILIKTIPVVLFGVGAY